MTLKDRAAALLAQADVRIGGDRPWDIQVHDDRLYARVARQGSVGLGEAYMDGWWDAVALDEFFAKVLVAKLEEGIGPWWQRIITEIVHRTVNFQSRSRAFQVGETHYDLGNDLYSRMLDVRMVYTCAYWKDAQTLDEAQEAKLDLVCRKLGLKAGQTVLDIGCGWGSFAQFAAETYGAEVVGVTVSKEQATLARERCAGLPVEIRVQDYRDITGTYDHAVSIEMFEAVGYKNFRTYMEVVRRSLRPGGLFVLQTIGGNRSVTSTDPWIEKYIFPNGMLPSPEQIGKAADGLFVVEDWHNIGIDYDRTLMEWHHRFEAAWSDLREKYGERFRRMWNYYLLMCAGSFRSRKNQDWQIVLSPEGMPGGYASVR